MKRNANIVFLTDLSSESLKSLDYALDYAKKNECSLTLLNVIEYPWRIVDSVLALIRVNVFNKTEVEEATNQLLQGLTSKINADSSIEVNYKILHGNPMQSILFFVAEHKPDMMIFGIECYKNHITYKLVNHIPIPVVTINNKTCFRNIKRILFPFNNRGINPKKVEELARISKIYKAEIVLLGIADNALGSLDEMSNYMKSVMKRLETKKVSTRLFMIVEEDYNIAIKKYSVENDIDLISVISYNDSGIIHFFRKFTNEWLMKEVNIPVLSIPVSTETI